MLERGRIGREGPADRAVARVTWMASADAARLCIRRVFCSVCEGDRHRPRPFSFTIGARCCQLAGPGDAKGVPSRDELGDEICPAVRMRRLDHAGARRLAWSSSGRRVVGTKGPSGAGRRSSIRFRRTTHRAESPVGDTVNLQRSPTRGDALRGDDGRRRVLDSGPRWVGERGPWRHGDGSGGRLCRAHRSRR